MTDATQQYIKLVLKFIDTVMSPDFKVSGIENLPDQPTLFVVNHFTRAETFIIPYIINKYSRKYIRCLADSSLFKGKFGTFLHSVGAFSTKEPNRDEIIISDLVDKKYNWVIYPEGSMIKSKKIINKGCFFIESAKGESIRPHTGSATLAIKAELRRLANKDKKNHQITVVPVNISYYPIRPGNNIFKKLAEKFIKDIPPSILEELEIEGNLLLNSEIAISFCNPINISQQIEDTYKWLKISFMGKGQKIRDDILIKYFRKSLTKQFMTAIYLNMVINIDHVFSANIYLLKKGVVSMGRLKRLIFFSSFLIKNLGFYKMHKFFNNDKILLVDEPIKELDDIIQLAINLEIIIAKPGYKNLYEINNQKIVAKHDFNNIRIENTIEVIANEFFTLRRAVNSIKRSAINIDKRRLKEKIFNILIEEDLQNFKKDYKKYFDPEFSKNTSVGEPFFLQGSLDRERIGIVLCHGYKAAPREVELLAQYLNGKGYSVYAVRLKGHGTSPKNMKDICWQDWYDSFNQAYSAVNCICDKIVICGFSTGGLLSLLAAARKTSTHKIKCVISINSALKLNDIRARAVPTVDLWNKLLEKFGVTKRMLEYIDDEPENPDINYSRNYIKGVKELSELMAECKDNLEKINIPTLVIQGDNDPIVNPKSGKIIFENIKSDKKELFMPQENRHVIVRGKGSEVIFDKIYGFVKKHA